MIESTDRVEFVLPTATRLDIGMLKGRCDTCVLVANGELLLFDKEPI